jgi:hypothetical protein
MPRPMHTLTRRTVAIVIAGRPTWKWKTEVKCKSIQRRVHAKIEVLPTLKYYSMPTGVTSNMPTLAHWVVPSVHAAGCDRVHEWLSGIVHAVSARTYC